MKFPAAGNFLARSYIAIVLGIIVIALLLDTLLAARSRGNMEAELRNTYAPLFALLETNLGPLPAATREAGLEALTAQWELPAGLLNIADFAGDEALARDLASGKILVFSNDEGEPVLYRRLEGSEQVLALGPLDEPTQNNLFESLVITAYYALVALLVLVWIRPFYRDLMQLRRTAADFGKSDFSARVRLSEKSSILPVAQSFNAMADRIEYLVSAHKELTHAVSHELRTPLARFRFSLEILARNTDPERKQDYINNMKADVAELETLIDELLSYARLSEENLLTNLVDLDLRSWLEEQLPIYSEEKISIGLSVRHHAPAGSSRVSLNPDLMARAIHNIVRNGLRYANRRIAIEAEVGEQVTISICDDGPGIPPDKQQSIFEPFSRLETSREKGSGGYGLGLAIAARILQRHQGRISVHNAPSGGACFVLQWPGTPADRNP